MNSKEVTINHNYTDCPLKLMRKHILAVDFILQGFEDHYVRFLSSIIDNEEYAEFQEEISEIIEEFKIDVDEIKKAADKFIKIPVVS